MPVITVRNDPSQVKAYIDINYVGAGLLLSVHWELDSNLITNVNQMITTGRIVTIELPSPPTNWAFIPGDHLCAVCCDEPHFKA